MHTTEVQGGLQSGCCHNLPGGQEIQVPQACVHKTFGCGVIGHGKRCRKAKWGQVWGLRHRGQAYHMYEIQLVIRVFRPRRPAIARSISKLARGGLTRKIKVLSIQSCIVSG